MTLITHIWTKDFNIVAADTRRNHTDENRNTEFIDDVCKLYFGNNFVIGVYGAFYIEGIKSLSQELQNFIDKHINDSGEKIAIKLLEFYKSLNTYISTKFIVAGRSNNVPRAYYLSNYEGCIKFDHLNIDSVQLINGYEFSLRTNKLYNHPKYGLMLMDSFNEKITIRNESEGNIELPLDNCINVLNDFYSKIIKDESEPGIGGEIQYVILKNDSIERSWS